MALKRAILLSLIVAAPMSCAGQGKSVGVGSPEASETDEAASDGSQIELLAPGAEPRRTLRYRIPSSGTWYSTTDIKQTRIVTVGSDPEQSTVQPTVRAQITTSAVPTERSGRIRLVLSYGQMEFVPEPGMAPEMVEQIEAMPPQSLPGLAITSESTTRGLFVQSDVNDVLASLSNEGRIIFQNFAQSMRAPLMTFPKEPIGVGARWTVTTPMDTPLMKAMTSMTYELTGLEGDVGTCAISSRMTMPVQDMRIPTEPGMSATIESAEGVVAGTTRFDLGTPQVTTDLRTEITMRMTITGELGSVPASNLTRIRLMVYPSR